MRAGSWLLASLVVGLLLLTSQPQPVLAQEQNQNQNCAWAFAEWSAWSATCGVMFRFRWHECAQGCSCGARPDPFTEHSIIEEPCTTAAPPVPTTTMATTRQADLAPASSVAPEDDVTSEPTTIGIQNDGAPEDGGSIGGGQACTSTAATTLSLTFSQDYNSLLPDDNELSAFVAGLTQRLLSIPTVGPCDLVSVTVFPGSIVVQLGLSSEEVRAAISPAVNIGNICLTMNGSLICNAPAEPKQQQLEQDSASSSRSGLLGNSVFDEKVFGLSDLVTFALIGVAALILAGLIAVAVVRRKNAAQHKHNEPGQNGGFIDDDLQTSHQLENGEHQAARHSISIHDVDAIVPKTAAPTDNAKSANHYDNLNDTDHETHAASSGGDNGLDATNDNTGNDVNLSHSSLNNNNNNNNNTSITGTHNDSHDASFANDHDDDADGGYLSNARKGSLAMFLGDDVKSFFDDDTNTNETSDAQADQHRGFGGGSRPNNPLANTFGRRVTNPNVAVILEDEGRANPLFESRPTSMVETDTVVATLSLDGGHASDDAVVDDKGKHVSFRNTLIFHSPPESETSSLHGDRH